MRGRLFKLSHQLGRHCFGALPVGTWIILIGIALVLVDLLPRVYIPLPVVVIAGVIALLTLGLMLWGKSTGGPIFRAGALPLERRDAHTPLRGLDHLDVRATGRLSVEGKERFFADLEAIYHTFETREHVVMAYVPQTRFLLAHSRREQVGMWYAFFKPEQIMDVECGRAEFGARVQPALRVSYQGERHVRQVILAFQDEGDLQRALDDLFFDLKS